MRLKKFIPLHDLVTGRHGNVSDLQKKIIENHCKAVDYWKKFKEKGQEHKIGKVLELDDLFKLSNEERLAEFHGKLALRNVGKYYQEYGKLSEVLSDLKKVIIGWHPAFSEKLEWYFFVESQKAGVKLPRKFHAQLESATNSARENLVNTMIGSVQLEELKNKGKKPD